MALQLTDSLIDEGPSRTTDQHAASREHELVEALRPSDTAAFWEHAFSWMFRTTLAIAVAKVGLVIAWCALTGRGIALDFWWNIVPHFDLSLDFAEFIKVVTASTWLGLGAMFLALALALRSANRARHVDSGDAFDAWISDNAALGTMLGALCGALVVLATIIFELARDRFIGAYVWPTPHVLAITLAGLPVVALCALGFTRWFSPPTSFADLGFEVLQTVAPAASTTSEEVVS